MATVIGSGWEAHGPLEGALGGAAEEGEAAGYAAGASGAGRAWPGGLSATGVGQEEVGTVGEGALPVEAGKIRLPALRPLGQVVGTYIVAVGVDGLYLLDQHAAHERVFFERLATGRGQVVTQALVVPTPVTLTAEQYRCWEAAAAELATAGFTVEPFGDDCVLLRAVPAAWPGDPTEGFLAVLARMDGGGAAPGPEDVRRAMAACRAAIKAGQRLAEEDIAALLRELAACAEPFTCPHGRPTVVRLGPDALGRLFRRR